jgi:hypothetical protein
LASEQVARVVRIPKDLYERVAEQASRDDRSINAEIVNILRKAIETKA